ncbi:STM4504/CBY_0614 family protein, partial [Klebsiella pneumoniae]
MAIYDLFSKRQKRLRGDVPDVYQYTNLPQNFRVQVVHIVKSTIGNDSDYNTPASQIYNYINNTLCREYGV